MTDRESEMDAEQGEELIPEDVDADIPEEDAGDTAMVDEIPASDDEDAIADVAPDPADEAAAHDMAAEPTDEAVDVASLIGADVPDESEVPDEFSQQTAVIERVGEPHPLPKDESRVIPESHGYPIELKFASEGGGTKTPGEIIAGWIREAAEEAKEAKQQPAAAENVDKDEAAESTDAPESDAGEQPAESEESDEPAVESSEDDAEPEAADGEEDKGESAEDASSEEKYQRDPERVTPMIHKPKKVRPALPNGAKIAILIVAILAFIAVVIGCVTLSINSGKVLKGVSVAGVDLSGLTQEEAADKIEAELGSRIAATTIQCVPNGEDQARLKAAYEAAGITDQEFSWTFNAETAGISLDAEQLAAEAYEIGRPVSGGTFAENMGSIFGDRWRSLVGHGIELDPTSSITYDEELLGAAITTMNARLEIPMENWNVVTSGTDVVVHEGHDGLTIDEDALKDKFTWAFLLEGGNTVSVGVPMKPVPIVIDQTKANECANHISRSIATPAYLVYGDQIWEISPADLGSWTYTRVEGEGDSARLVAYIDTDVAVSGFASLMGPQAYGNAVDATFDVSSGVPVVVPSVVGTGPNLTDGALLLSEMVYGDTMDGSVPDNSGETNFEANTRHINIADAEKQPNITTEDAQSYGINELIASYTLHYGYAEGTNREHNIELALDMMNGTLVAPGETWSWVDDMGPCGYEEGFLAAGAIGEGGTSIQEAGGGICNVATCLFNVVYDAGLQIDERHNHSEYLENYPYGRDCTVSYPSVTFTWTNDYANYVYVTTSYDGYDMTISIWGTSEGRTVESNSSDFVNNSIYNWRTVRDASGNVIHEDTFYSYFRY